jgi:hypothetical protein
MHTLYLDQWNSKCFVQGNFKLVDNSVIEEDYSSEWAPQKFEI